MRRLIKRHWIRGKESDGHGGYCLLGAIHKVDTEFEDEAISLLERRLIKRGYYGIPTFNDYGTTGKDDVLKFLDEVIASVKS